MPGDPVSPPDADSGLRRMLKWVLAALILTVLFAVLMVELTLHWLNY